MDSKDLVVGQWIRVVVKAPLLQYKNGKHTAWVWIGAEKATTNFPTMMGEVSSTRIGVVVSASLVGQVRTVGKRGSLYLRAPTITAYTASVLASHIVSVELLSRKGNDLEEEES